VQNQNYKYLESINNPLDFIEGFKDDRAVDFLRRILKRNYSRFFTDHKEEAEQLVDDIFDILQEATNTNGDVLATFNDATEKIIEDLFHGHDPNHWYAQGYKHYKSVVKPKTFLDILEPHLVGPRILDFGTGRGYLAKLLISKGYKVGLTDVIDQLPNDCDNLDFRLMQDELSIPFENDQFDTVIVKTVLHHIEKENMKAIFTELKRVSKRLVIVEDLPFADDYIAKEINNGRIKDDLIKEFLYDLTQEQRLIICKIMDYFGNVLAQGLYYLNFPFNFHTKKGWENLGKEAELSIVDTASIAFQEVGLHTFFQTILVFESDG
jgi:ubiquinone/menaquinone biosynthesis C-methylase UbiE